MYDRIGRDFTKLWFFERKQLQRRQGQNLVSAFTGRSQNQLSAMYTFKTTVVFFINLD